ncbi:serine hydrolase domain-containing protein [Actinoplanes sp. NPDC051851]|uniref:serine hydrolase domain-containing protein n=1 Tax=Actinoplanes sp. NPDC051851 TaxID=3154753 RepID=UPI003429613D
MPEYLTRRTVLRAAATTAVAATVAPALTGAASKDPLGELDARIHALMAAYQVPGVALGLRHRGSEYVRSYGVTSIETQTPVDETTVFRVASTSKTFTGTAVMRLVERGALDLDRTVRSYLPDFRTSDGAASARVTVRQLLNHSAGWLGDYFLDTGDGDDALAAYVDGMSRLPQLTPPGKVFAYNNAALSLAGRLIEKVTGAPYEQAMRTLVLDPLRLRHSGYAIDDIPGVSMAVPHYVTADGVLTAEPALWDMPRGINPAGGLISTARDQLAWARYHLGDGRPLLSSRSLRLMQSHPGPGGTLLVELDGMGVTWMIRPTAEGPTVIQHGGDWSGQHSGFLLVPSQDFALTILTNAESGPALLDDFFAGDGALHHFTGLHNLPAEPYPLPAGALAAYTGTYTADAINFYGEVSPLVLDITPADGRLDVALDGERLFQLAFYRDDYAVPLDPATGTVLNARVNFLRAADGPVQWLRFSGRLFRHAAEAASSLRAASPRRRPLLPFTLPHP